MLGERSQEEMTRRLGVDGSGRSVGWMTGARRGLAIQGKQASLGLQWEQ